MTNIVAPLQRTMKRRPPEVPNARTLAEQLNHNEHARV
jgi:hypothetical protein